jgi:hypothetical protein
MLAVVFIMSKYQTKIVEALKNGAKLQCTEGANYKSWLVYPDGKKVNVRRDSVNKVCSDFESKLVFGEWSGIRWRS